MKFQNSPEHLFLPIPFTILTLCGTWYPEIWSVTKKRIYKCCTIVLLLLGITLFLEIFTYIIITSGTDKFSLENVFAANVFVVGIYKKMNIVRYRQEILELIFLIKKSKWHNPQNSAEVEIHKNNQLETRRISFIYTIFIGLALLLRSVAPIIESGTIIILPLEAWYPYNVNSLIMFWFTYFHQVVCGVMLTCMHLTSDILFVSLLLQVNYQLKILKCRLQNLGNEDKHNHGIQYKVHDKKVIKDIIVQHIEEHESIYRFGNKLQKTFQPTLMGQMVVLIPNLIINIYFLSVYNERLNLKYVMTIVFALVPLMQICMFCWYGNELVVGSLEIGDALYECDWTGCDQPTKKLLLTIITRTSKSILISAGSVIPLNIESFIKIMKTSYSAFNLLQQTTVD